MNRSIQSSVYPLGYDRNANSKRDAIETANFNRWATDLWIEHGLSTGIPDRAVNIDELFNNQKPNENETHHQ